MPCWTKIYPHIYWELTGKKCELSIISIVTKNIILLFNFPSFLNIFLFLYLLLSPFFSTMSLFHLFSINYFHTFSLFFPFFVSPFFRSLKAVFRGKGGARAGPISGNIGERIIGEKWYYQYMIIVNILNYIIIVVVAVVVVFFEFFYFSSFEFFCFLFF